MKKNIVITVLLIIGIFICGATAHAEIQTYEGTGEYLLMEGETQNFGKERAKKIAERDALEQVYLYVRSLTSVKNSNLTKDEIITISAGFMCVVDKKFSVTCEYGSFIIKAVVIAEINPDEVAEEVEHEKRRRLAKN